MIVRNGNFIKNPNNFEFINIFPVKIVLQRIAVYAYLFESIKDGHFEK